MAILNPDHLLEQARRLVVAPPAGPPRQVDVRRGVSAAYYAVFHAVIAAAADQAVGVSLRSNPFHALVYRSIDHKKLRDFCVELSRPTPPAKYKRYIPAGGFDVSFDPLILGLPVLQERRHEADYDPALRFRTKDAIVAVELATAAIAGFRMAPPEQRKAFLYLLLFPPKR